MPRREKFFGVMVEQIFSPHFSFFSLACARKDACTHRHLGAADHAPSCIVLFLLTILKQLPGLRRRAS